MNAEGSTLLTADLVHARRKGGELRVTPLDAAGRARATVLANLYLELAQSQVGCSRAELDEAWTAVSVGPRERRLADGIRKLVEDRCTFTTEPEIDPEELRRATFTRASAARRDGDFVRARVLATIADERNLSPVVIEQALYADLRGAHTLERVEPISAVHLVDAYDLMQEQAVLLRAVRVTVDVDCRAPGAYRALFAKLKFLRLLYRIQPRGAGYRLEIDGPFSLFESVTKYGLQLACALPALRACDRFTLEAEIRWGKDRAPLSFRLAGQRAQPSETAPPLADDVARLLGELRGLNTPWKAEPANEILSLPGQGLCVPDLVCQHEDTGECVYIEVLGFWSREAVWRRVELVERGLEHRILFAVSKHLRVSEAALDDEQPSALYVYKRVMHARTILDRIEALARRVPRGPTDPGRPR